MLKVGHRAQTRSRYLFSYSESSATVAVLWALCIVASRFKIHQEVVDAGK